MCCLLLLASVSLISLATWPTSNLDDHYVYTGRTGLRLSSIRRRLIALSDIDLADSMEEWYSSFTSAKPYQSERRLLWQAGKELWIVNFYRGPGCARHWAFFVATELSGPGVLHHLVEPDERTYEAKALEGLDSLRSLRETQWLATLSTSEHAFVENLLRDAIIPTSDTRRNQGWCLNALEMMADTKIVQPEWRKRIDDVHEFQKEDTVADKADSEHFEDDDWWEDVYLGQDTDVARDDWEFLEVPGDAERTSDSSLYLDCRADSEASQM